MNPGRLPDGRYEVVVTTESRASLRDWPFDRYDKRVMLPGERCVLFVERGPNQQTCKLVGRDGFSAWAGDGNFRMLSPLEELAGAADG